MLEMILRDETCRNIDDRPSNPPQELVLSQLSARFERKILFIRPKLLLANTETIERCSTMPWMRQQHVEGFYLPKNLTKLQWSAIVTSGDYVLSIPDTTIGAETWYIRTAQP
jgi:NAD+ synthase (glutamine-hydrolysing)